MKLADLRAWTWMVPALTLGLVVGACSSDDDDDSGDGTGGTTGSGGDPGAAGDAGAGAQPASGGSGDTGGSGGTTEGSGGSAGQAAAQKDCAVKMVITQPAITDFETYDGTTDLSEWVFSFNDDGTGNTAVYAGVYGYDDATGSPSFGMVGGNAGSAYGVSISNSTEATAWGGGMGIWMGCIDASAYTGIRLWVRGSTPSGTVSISLAMEETTAPDEDDPAAGGTCIATGAEGECAGPSASFAVTDSGTQVEIPWTGFTAGTAAAGVSVPATGNNITGIGLSVSLNWIEDPSDPGNWIPVAAPYELVIDDLELY